MNGNTQTGATFPGISRAGITGAVILGGAHGSLAIARSLGRRGIPVWFVTDDNPITKFSRYCRRSFRWSGPQHEDALDDLLELARDHGLEGWVLFAGGDAEVRLIAQHHAELSKVFRLTTPPWSVAKFAYDKRLTHQHAATVGVDYPWSRYPRSRREISELECHFPLILKPTVRQGHDPFTSAKAWRVNNRTELLSRYDQAVALVGMDVVSLQEMIPGGGEAQFSYAAVCRHGKPIASLTARRTRQYPIEFGFTSTCVEAVEKKQVEDAARRFLGSLQYDGIVEVEFKYDARDGRFKLLDVNARPWTWNALGAAAGADFAYVAWQLAVGEQVSRVRGRPGATWLHLSRDLVAAWQNLLRGGAGSTGYLNALRGRVVFAAFAMDDPLPGIIDLPLTLWRTLTKRRAAQALTISTRGTQDMSEIVNDTIQVGSAPIAPSLGDTVEPTNGASRGNVWANAVRLRRQIVRNARTQREASERLHIWLRAQKQRNLDLRSPGIMSQG